MNLCKCNCGQVVKKNWIQGHNLRVKNPMSGKPSWNKGKTGIFSAEHRKKISLARARQVFSVDAQRKKSESLKRAYATGLRDRTKCAFYIDGRHAGKTPIKQSFEYRAWRESVFRRDDYTCQDCGERGGELQADHIKPQSIYPEYRFDLDNGRTLCRPCHQKTDTWGVRLWNNKSETTNLLLSA